MGAGRADEHAQHRARRSAAAIATPARSTISSSAWRRCGLDPPVRIYLPSETRPTGACAAETQNRPRVRELELDARSGDVLRDKGFGGKSRTIDRVIGVGIAAHEGQLFGIANQLLGLFTALGLIALCISAVVMWWRRRPDGALGVPAPRVEGFTIQAPLLALIVSQACCCPCSARRC